MFIGQTIPRTAPVVPVVMWVMVVIVYIILSVDAWRQVACQAGAILWLFRLESKYLTGF